MSEKELRQEQEPSPKKPKKGLQSILAWAVLGILIVMILINFWELKQPVDYLFSVLSPITIGLVLAYILNYFMRFFEVKVFRGVEKRSLNRAFSMICSYLFLLLIIAGVMALIAPQLYFSINKLISNLSTSVDTLFDSIYGVLEKLPIDLPATVMQSIEELMDVDTLIDRLVDMLSSLVDGTTTDDQNAGLLGSFGSSLINFGIDAVTVIKNVIVGIFISIYVLLSKERLNAGCRRVIRALCSETWEKRILYYVGTAHRKIGGYIIGKMIDSAMVGVVCYILFKICGIPHAELISVIIGVTDFIPFFGPFIGAIPSGVIVFLDGLSSGDEFAILKVLLFALLILIVQQIDGNIIAPAILGDSTGLSSLGVIVAITVMGELFGLPGMLIGVPIFALIMIILDDFIKSRLRAKGHDTDLKQYYPADAFIRPQDEKREDNTLTQKFVKWVCTVETEQAGVDYKPSKAHDAGRTIRRAFLTVGRFFRRVFSVKPIPEDRSGSIFSDIAQNGMRTNRLFLRTVGFSIVTLGIYPFYLVEVIAQSTNIACRHDRQRTWGLVPYLLLSVITFGIFPLAWHCQIISRMRRYCAERGVTCCTTVRSHLCWTIFGSLILVGPLIALAKFLRCFSQMCATYNANHTFPLSPETFKLEKQILKEPKRRRTPLIDQISEGIPELPKQDTVEDTAPVDTAVDTATDDNTNGDGTTGA